MKEAINKAIKDLEALARQHACEADRCLDEDYSCCAYSANVACEFAYNDAIQIILYYMEEFDDV